MKKLALDYAQAEFREYKIFDFLGLIGHFRRKIAKVIYSDEYEIDKNSSYI